MGSQRVGRDRVAELNKYKRGNQSNTIIIKDVNTPLITRDRSSTQKFNMEIQALNHMLD